jgi:hypothetical protein
MYPAKFGRHIAIFQGTQNHFPTGGICRFILPCIRAVYYGKALDLGVVCEDSKPEFIVAKEMRRDGDIEADDNFAIILDTYLDHRNAFYFIVNPNGARKDALVVDEGANQNVIWNGVWDAKAVVTDKGWQFEVMIPFDSLRFKNADQQLWGINFRRMIRRKNEEVLWQAHRRNDGLGKIGKFDLGFLNVQTRSLGTNPAADYSAIRPKYGMLNKSYVGGIFTNVYNTRDGNRNQAYGLDSVLSFSNFFGQNLSISSSFVQTSTPVLKGDRSSGYFAVNYPNDWLEAFFNYSFIRKNFNPELGFLKRKAVEQL